MLHLAFLLALIPCCGKGGHVRQGRCGGAEGRAGRGRTTGGGGLFRGVKAPSSSRNLAAVTTACSTHPSTPNLLPSLPPSISPLQVMKDFVQLKQIEDVLDKGRAVKHSKLSQLTEEVITDPTKVKGGEG